MNHQIDSDVDCLKEEGKKMNIIEAVKSGKRFRRIGWGDWVDFRIYSGTQVTSGDILATDWEIEEEKIEITKSQLDQAFDKCCNMQFNWGYEYLWRELGGK